MSRMKVAGKHVVVTGAASGIGAELARRFEAEGARVVVGADLHTEGIPVADAVRCDVSHDNDLLALIDGAEQRNGPIDLFCSNAGILGGFGAIELTDAEWQ